jgi:hypothetical protein
VFDTAKQHAAMLQAILEAPTLPLEVPGRIPTLGQRAKLSGPTHCVDASRCYQRNNYKNPIRYGLPGVSTDRPDYYHLNGSNRSTLYLSKARTLAPWQRGKASYLWASSSGSGFSARGSSSGSGLSYFSRLVKESHRSSLLANHCSIVSRGS